MRRNVGTKGAFLLLAAMLALAGCAGAADRRTPEEWLSLSYSGLAAMDEFSFAGSLSMGVEEGVMFKPQTFEGKVVNHNQLTLQSEGQHPLYWNPVEVLEHLNRSNGGVSAVKEERTEWGDSQVETLWLKVKETPEATTQRWQKQLRSQLEELEGTLIRQGGDASAARAKLLEEARAELEGMLQTLEASSEYNIAIHKRKLIPLKMEEHTTFSYERDGRPVKESRSATVRFQPASGS